MHSKKFNQFIKMWAEEFGIARTINEGICVAADGSPLPWYTYPAIEYLVQFNFAKKMVFEFGCGMSTRFWAERARKVIGVEDNADWFARWQKEINFDNVDIFLCPENAGYAEVILKQHNKFDVIVIDGKQRAACCQNALKKLKKGGVIILDDTDRAATSIEYRQAVKTLHEAGLLQIDFFGCCPMNVYTKTTSLFLHRDFAFERKEDTAPSAGIGNLWHKGRRARKQFVNEFK